MTDKERFLDMLTGANVPHSTKQVRRARQTETLVEVDGGNGALATFVFGAEGILVAFDLDKDAY